MERNYTKELDILAKDFNKSLVDELNQSIKSICKYYQLTTNDLCKLCDIDSVVMDELMKGDTNNDCLYDLRTITLLTLLSNGRLNVLDDTPDGKMFNEVNRIIKDYQDEKNPPKKETYDWDTKVKEMLEMFGVKNIADMEHLLNAVKSVRNTIDSYEKYCECDNRNSKCSCEDHNDKCECQKNETKPCSKNDSDQVYVDADGNFHSQKPYTNEKNVGKVNGCYYDSKTMDKPKEFEFSGNFEKILPNVLNLISNYINKLNL